MNKKIWIFLWIHQNKQLRTITQIFVFDVSDCFLKLNENVFQAVKKKIGMKKYYLESGGDT